MADAGVKGHSFLRPGGLVDLDGVIHRMVRFERGPAGMEVVFTVANELVRLTLSEVYQRVRPTTMPQVRVPDRLELPTSWIWHALNEAERQRLERRARDLLELRSGSRRGLAELDRLEGLLDPRYDPTITTLGERVAHKSRELRARGEFPSSESQLYRQLSMFDQDGVLGLVHRNRRIPLGVAELPDDVREVLQEFVAEQPDRPRVDNTVLAALAQARLWDTGFEVSFTADEMARLLGELTRGQALHREAKSRRNRTRDVGRTYGSLTASRPGELVQIDATETTMHPWFPRVGRAKAYILSGIDVYTRMVVACRVVANAPSSRDVAMLLWDMGRPQVTRAGWPYQYQLVRGLPRFVTLTAGSSGLRVTRPAVIGTKLGIRPSFVVMDHGRENESLHLLSAAARNGINLIYCPPAAGWAKGIVESLHRVLDQVQSLFLGAGYKGASVANHPKDNAGEVCLTMGDLHDALWSAFLGVYNNTEHHGLTDPLNPALRATPNQILENYLTVVGEVPVPTDPWRVIDFLSSEPRRLEDYGINLHGLVYQSDELMDLRQFVQPGLGRPGHLMDVRYDRYDLSRVFVQHPVTRQWLSVPVGSGVGRTMAPFGEALLHEAITRDDRARGYTATQRLDALARLSMAWSRGVFADRRQQRQADFEASRREAWAKDLEDSPLEYRSLIGRLDITTTDDDPEADEEYMDLSAYENGWQEGIQ